MQIDKNESYNLDFNPKLDILKLLSKEKKECDRLQLQRFNCKAMT